MIVLRFWILKKNIARDKNNLYIQGIPVSLPSQEHFSLGNYQVGIIKEDSAYIFPGYYYSLNSYKVDEIISDIAFKRNDSLFVFYDNKYVYFPSVADPKSLKIIQDYYYRDKNNLYKYNGSQSHGYVEVFEEEQIVGKKTFYAYEEERRSTHDYILIGKKNLYTNHYLSDKSIDFYQFFDDSFYFLFNQTFRYFRNNNYMDPIVANDTILKVTRKDSSKVRFLGKNVLIYYNKFFFWRDKQIHFPLNIDLSKIEFVEQFRFRLDIKMLAINKSRIPNESPIFRYGDKLYAVDDRTYHLVAINAAKSEERGIDIKGNDLKNLHIYNEYYFTDVNILYSFYQLYEGRDKKLDYITKADIDFSQIKIWGRFFSDGKSLYYNYMPVEAGKTTIKYPENNRRLIGLIDLPIGIEANVSDIKFNKLKLIDGMEDYITDGHYLIYKNNMVGVIDYNTIKVHQGSLIEDGTQYFQNGMSIKKEQLGIKLILRDK